MNPILDTHKNEIAALCDKYGVTTLDAFGIANTPEYDPSRDFLEFVAGFADGGDMFLRLTGLIVDLESLLEARVLVVEDDDLSDDFLRSIGSTRETLIVATDHKVTA